MSECQVGKARPWRGKKGKIKLNLIFARLKGYLKVHHQHGATCTQVDHIYQLIQIIDAGDTGVLPLGLGFK